MAIFVASICLIHYKVLKSLQPPPRGSAVPTAEPCPLCQLDSACRQDHSFWWQESLHGSAPLCDRHASCRPKPTRSNGSYFHFALLPTYLAVTLLALYVLAFAWR
jgi:hypothetical protein